MKILVDGREVNGRRPVPVGVMTDEGVETLAFYGLPTIAEGQVVTIHYGDVATMTKAEDGAYLFTVESDLTSRVDELIDAYIRIDTGSAVWNTEAFRLELKPLPDVDGEYISRESTLLDTILAGEAARETAEAARQAAAEAYLSHPTTVVDGVVQVWDSQQQAYVAGQDLVAAVIAALPTVEGVGF